MRPVHDTVRPGVQVLLVLHDDRELEKLPRRGGLKEFHQRFGLLDLRFCDRVSTTKANRIVKDVFLLHRGVCFTRHPERSHSKAIQGTGFTITHAMKQVHCCFLLASPHGMQNNLGCFVADSRGSGPGHEYVSSLVGVLRLLYALHLGAEEIEVLRHASPGEGGEGWIRQIERDREWKVHDHRAVSVHPVAGLLRVVVLLCPRRVRHVEAAGSKTMRGEDHPTQVLTNV